MQGYLELSKVRILNNLNDFANTDSFNFIEKNLLYNVYLGTARGVPMLFIPFFADQRGNALRTERNGNGLTLPFVKITNDTFSASINELLTNKAYLNRAKELAILFNDNLVHPMNESIYWIEYVMRSKGAKHLKSNAVNMPWFSVLLLDVIILPIGIVALLYFGLKSLIRFVGSKSSGENTKVPRKKTKRA